uniref:ZP domain-containing protein n=1 Tax=Cyprinus carpio carpio TaxID=630221 RepID=A0A9J7Y4R7_CYPCA
MRFLISLCVSLLLLINESTMSSSDPCYDYTTLDEYWRDIQQSPYEYFENDDTLVEWSGWYRLYLNGESAQMSEWCVSHMRCGGYTGLYLNDSHPTLEDGVVTREVLGSNSLWWWEWLWAPSSQCGDYTSTSIQVKACPGDYYVYEFVKPNISAPWPSYCAVAFSNISSDPCYNYESLDRPWRANNESGDWICDESFSWNGWYRLFYYGMDIQMSETCVDSYSCNTIYNLWLNGPHPQIEDGEVIREVCAGSYWGICCEYKTNPIRVKACPGNYYVYELVNPQFWCSGYCTDVNTISWPVSTVSPDIITGSSIPLNYDPCNNYNILDNYWRSTFNYWSMYGYISDHDDTRVEWDGWYRLFINGSSAQMPEWCMSYMSCGGFSSLYLGGSHPQLEDGVVTREIYGSHHAQCSYYRSEPIQVKACPGDYYVYKFNRPTISIPAPVYCAVPFSTPSVDPCYSYTSLDEPWRATDNPYYNNYYSYGMCDYNVEWNGWYRLFYNGENAHMPESCVNYGMCGTYEPLWLNGPHPQLEDGVVTRQVCASTWSGCCEYTSHPIRVKACPGNYYVYEFVKPIFCGDYCVEASWQPIISVSTATETVLPTESIAPPITTTAPPVDPCYNYNVLDDPWRATNNQHSSLIMCDVWVSWSGWYRLFIQDQSVQMPDTCVEEYSCGTNAPLWLNGEHPTVEDGVVTRDVCGHWNNDCCYFQSNPIKVKACPGDYYVYEFVSPIACNLAYCADAWNINNTYTTETTTTTETVAETTMTVNRNPCSELSCSEDEECGMNNGVYGCLCENHRQRQHHDSFDFSETCESSSGSMSVSRCQLFEAGFPADVLHLNDPSCKGTVRNGRVEFQFDNDEHICGTNLVANGTHFIYSNFILGAPRSEGLISREKILKLSFSCVYPQTQTLSMNAEINPLETVVHETLPTGEGRYQVRMTPYEDDEFTRPFTGRVDAELDQKMNVEVRVEGVDSRQFALVVDTCWATPVNDPDYSLRWDLIVTECPNPIDDTVELLQNGVSTSSRFSFRMFIFTANSTKLYLHCTVHLCLLSSNSCPVDCNSGHQRREGRSLNFHDSASISMGPLTMSEGNTDKWFPDQVKVSEASCLCASLMLLLVPLMSVLT